MLILVLMAVPFMAIAEEVPEAEEVKDLKKTEEIAKQDEEIKKIQPPPELTATVTLNIQYRQVPTKYIPGLHAKAKKQFPQAIVKIIVE